MQSYLLITKIIRKMNYAMFENVIFEAVVGNVCFQIIFIFIIQHMRNWKRVFALKNTHSNDYLSIIQQICILQQEDSFPTNHIHLISFLTNSYPIELTSQQEKQLLFIFYRFQCTPLLPALIFHRSCWRY